MPLALTMDQQYYLMAGAVLLLPAIPIALYLLGRKRAQRPIPPDTRPTYTGPTPAPDDAIKQTRSQVGPPRDGRVPRVFARGWPPWMERSDPLKHLYRAQQGLLDHGHVVWGWIVQANRLLMHPGTTDSPAAVVYSDDPYFDASPTELSDVAEQLFDLKGRGGVDKDLQWFAYMLADEVIREPKVQVPLRLTAGRRVYFTSIVVMRAHLPRGVLARPLVPLLIRPERTPWTLILPSHFWAPSLVRDWKSAMEEAAGSITGA
jgi:hypothetical protein